jgi:hypothetical protein
MIATSAEQALRAEIYYYERREAGMQEGTGIWHRNLSNASFILGAAVIILIAAILLISSMLFAVGSPLLPANFWLALAVTMLATWLMCNRYFPSKRWLAFIGIMAGLTIIFLLCLYLSGSCYDLSSDGQTYQQEGIIQLANGWDPFHGAPLQVANSFWSKHYTKDPDPSVAAMVAYDDIWINHYTKGPWISSASLYVLTGHIEQGKVFNILLVVSSFFFCLSALLPYYRQRLLKPLLFSALAACNPVSILQLPTFYIDGQLSSILVISLALLFMIVKTPDVWSALVLLLSVIIAVNIKYTGLAYLLALGLPVMLYLWLVKARLSLKLIASSLAIGLIAGSLFVGFNPYVTNTIRNGNPLYPLAGPGAVDIMTANSPANFHGMNRFEKLFISTFSETADIATPYSTRWKWPFTVSKDELGAFQADTRVAGFGPLFGGAVLLSLILLATAWPLDKKKTVVFTGLGLLITCSALVNPEAWWARYAPQLWLLPVLGAMLGLSMSRKPQKILGLAIALVLMINLFMVAIPYFAQQYIADVFLKKQLVEMRKDPIVLVSFGSDYSNRARLTEAGIRYWEVARLDGPGVQTMVSSNTYTEGNKKGKKIFK